MVADIQIGNVKIQKNKYDVPEQRYGYFVSKNM